MDESTTLADLLELNLHECEEEVKNIVDKAVKEMSMEKYMKELNVTWSKMEFEREIHARTGATLIRASEELIETLEENQVRPRGGSSTALAFAFSLNITRERRLVQLIRRTRQIPNDSNVLRQCHSVFTGVSYLAWTPQFL